MLPLSSKFKLSNRIGVLGNPQSSRQYFSFHCTGDSPILAITDSAKSLDDVGTKVSEELGGMQLPFSSLSDDYTQAIVNLCEIGQVSIKLIWQRSNNLRQPAYMWGSHWRILESNNLLEPAYIWGLHWCIGVSNNLQGGCLRMGCSLVSVTLCYGG